MAHPTYPLEVVTPEGVEMTGSVQSLKLPGADGSFGILAQHAAMLAALDIGLLEVIDAAGKTETWAIGEGFVQVTSGDDAKVRVLTEFVNRGGQVDVERAEASRKRAEERLDLPPDEGVDRARAEAALERARLRLAIARLNR
jgi:F-type H+-transporting ATPase subunit epsilon